MTPPPDPTTETDRAIIVVAILAHGFDDVGRADLTEAERRRVGACADQIIEALARRGRLVVPYVHPTGSGGTTSQGPHGQLWNAPPPRVPVEGTK